MATTRKSAGRKTGAKKPAGGITKAKVKRVARKAEVALGTAAHDATLALRRVARKLKRTAKKLETKLQEAKGPAKRTARRVERKVTIALEGAGESISSAGHRAKASFDAAKQALVEATTTKKPATTKRAAKKPAAKKSVAKKPGAKKSVARKPVAK
jgi:histone H1/5